jgi:hypothetical protein
MTCCYFWVAAPDHPDYGHRAAVHRLAADLAGKRRADVCCGTVVLATVALAARSRAGASTGLAETGDRSIVDERQFNDERASQTWACAFRADVPPVMFHETPDEREPDTQAIGSAS